MKDFMSFFVPSKEMQKTESLTAAASDIRASSLSLDPSVSLGLTSQILSGVDQGLCQALDQPWLSPRLSARKVALKNYHRYALNWTSKRIFLSFVGKGLQIMS